MSIDVTDDPSLVREMALAGCTGVFVGFESLADENLAEARKKTPARRTMRGGWRSCTTTASRSTAASSWASTTTARTCSSGRSPGSRQNRLECATFHILTPYPGTPLFRADGVARGGCCTRTGRRYDTAHAVFRPKHMTPEELEEGYAWCYDRLFSHGSIWRRRPDDWRAVPPYLAMSYLYKRSNRLWHLLIRHRLTGPVWRPLVEWTRRRHLRFRRRLELERCAVSGDRPMAGTVVSAGV